MKTLLKLFASAWLVAGFLWACVALNPLLFRVAARVTPVWDDNSEYSWSDVPWDCTDAGQISYVWLCTAGACTLCVLAVGLAYVCLEELFAVQDESDADPEEEGEVT